MIVLGISCFYHDSAAAIIIDGRIKAAAEEERFTRKKHDRNFPHNSIKYCLDELKITLEEVDSIVFYDKPILKFDRILESYLTSSPNGLKQFIKSIPIWIKEKIFFKRLVSKSLNLITPCKKTIYFSEHHLSHAASAFFPSPYRNAAILCIDGVGEWASTSAWVGNGNTIKPLFEIEFPHSLGLFYSSFTGLLGFKVNSGEYKLMGLAPYGRPIFADKILNECIKFFEDGSFQLNFEYFDFISSNRMYTEKLENLFGIKTRDINDSLEQIHFDIAASVQFVLEKAVLGLVEMVKHLSSSDSLVMAGGVALNCVANSKIKQANFFQNIWIQPAAGDSGGALGAALAYYYLEKKQEREIENNSMSSSLLGPRFSLESIKNLLDSYKCQYYFFEEVKNVNNFLVRELTHGKVIGLFRGKMEFGPRALGARSILADPRIENMRNLLNSKIKKRESFRPFAPAVLKEHVSAFFDWDVNDPSPYMLFTGNSLKPKELPSVTHCDGSSRIQIVDKDIHHDFYELINAFYQHTQCPVLINTSFNVRGEPIVMSPYDALNCFMTTEIDVLVLENFILLKQEQSEQVLNLEWRHTFEND